MLLWLLACGKELDSNELADSAGTVETGTADLLPPVIEGEADDFYAAGQVRDIHLRMTEAALESLRGDPRSWVEGEFQWEESWYGPVGIRIKGEQSYRDIDEKPSLKIKFSEYQDDGRFLGMRRIVFNNMIGDNSMLRERLAYRVFREYGSPAPRANHVNVFVNGERYGLYANVENTDEELLKEWFDNDEGSMWEIHDADFQPDLTVGFEIEEGNDDRTQIDALTATMQGERATQDMFDYVDKDAWYRYFPVMAFIGNLDGYPFSEPGDDAHLYQDPTSGKFHFIPHGLDETFLDDASVEYVMHGVLATACMADESACKVEWRAALQAVIDFAPGLSLEASVVDIVAEIQPHVEADTRKEFSDADIAIGQGYLTEYIRLRSADLEEQLTW